MFLLYLDHRQHIDSCKVTRVFWTQTLALDHITIPIFSTVHWPPDRFASCPSVQSSEVLPLTLTQHGKLTKRETAALHSRDGAVSPGILLGSLNYPEYSWFNLIKSAVFKVVQRSHYYPWMEQSVLAPNIAPIKQGWENVNTLMKSTSPSITRILVRYRILLLLLCTMWGSKIFCPHHHF